MRSLQILTVVLFPTFSSFAFATPDSIGPNGINSAVLTGLSGNNVLIGQVELGRTGGANFDTTAANHHDQINIAQAYQDSGTDTANNASNITPHATAVAGVMVAKPGNGLDGVAPNAQLHAAAGPPVLGQISRGHAAAMNQLARINGMRAINLSFGFGINLPDLPDGENFMSQFVDWSAKEHEVLYVVAGDESGFQVVDPQASFNGITVGYSRKSTNSTRWDKTDPNNDLGVTPLTSRTAIDILAPGTDLTLAQPNNATTTMLSGTSFAASYVTSAIALLDEYATRQIPSNPRFNSTNPHLPLVLKAIILNSADKIAGVHGSQRTVTDRNNNNWTQLSAINSSFKAMEDDFGVGHLNVQSAITQFEPGEYNPGMVPNVGWDFNFVGAGFNEYEFTTPGSGWIAATLTWNRDVDISTVNGRYNSTATFFDQPLDDQLENLNLYLMDANSNNPFDGPTRSLTTVDNVEHIFFNVQTAGNYKLRVQNDSQLANGEDYALAWWFGETPPITVASTDFDNDGDVDGDDLGDWAAAFASTDGGDADGDGDSDGADFLRWQREFTGVSALSTSTAVPEPTSFLLLAIGLPVFLTRQRK